MSKATPSMASTADPASASDDATKAENHIPIVLNRKKVDKNVLITPKVELAKKQQ